jgi:hypothetical protein
MVVALFGEEQYAPLPLDSSGKKLCEIFPYLWQTITGQNDPDPQWQTITKYPLRPRVLWKLWQDANQLVGVRFDSLTCYGMLDIDRQSLYHPANDPTTLKLIRAALETIGLYRTVLIRSSFSEGLHLYIPLPVSLPTFGLASALKQCLEAQGLEVKAGQLEIFPNCKAYAIPGTYTEYNAHRLPLQPSSGSYLLDDDLNPISQDLGRFFESWDVAAAGQLIEELQGAIALARSSNKARRQRRANVVEDWLQDLRTEMQEGWTGHGQTNHLLKTIACYGVVFEGLKGDALAEFVRESAINSPGYEQWCRHQHEIGLRSTVWARSAEGYYWKLGDSPKRTGSVHSEAGNNIVPFNLSRSQDARRRIQEVVRQLEQQGQLPDTATARLRAIAQQRISSRTLYRHLELWHPLHFQSDKSGSCKTSELETVVAIFERETQTVAESPEALAGGKFYTIEENMKCSPPESDPAIFAPSNGIPDDLNLQKPPRRESLTESVTVNQSLKTSELFLEKDLKSLETGTLAYPPRVVGSHQRVVLVKLLEMWMDGYQQLVQHLQRSQRWRD